MPPRSGITVRGWRMDWATVAAVAAMLVSGAAWGARVEMRLSASEKLTVDATTRLACQMKEFSQLLNWLGAAVEAQAGQRPVPPRPLVIETDCEP